MATMKRLSVVLSMAILLVGFIALGGSTGRAYAQDATPAAGGFEIAPGVTAEAIAFVPGEEAPTLYRLTLDAGVTYTFEPSVEISLVYGEIGSLVAALNAPVTVFHAIDVGQPGEAVPAGGEVRIDPGDYVVFPPLVEGAVTNAGKEAASVLVAAIVPLPGVETETDVATPIP
jgi:hypothetical protein